MRRIIPVALAAACAATPLQAQFPPSVTASLGGSSTRVRAVTTVGQGTLSGVTGGGAARFSRGLLSLEGAYRQGSLTPDSGVTTAQDLVEARLLGAVRPRPWLAILAGPHARAFVGPSGTERWVFWEGRVRAEGAIMGEVVRTHVELWAALAGNLNIGSGTPSARGGEVALTVHLPRSPVWARLMYGIDHATQSGSGNARTVEDIGLSIGIGNR